MPTRLFLRALTPDNSPGETERSTALPVGTFKDFLLAVRALETTKGAAQTSGGSASLAQTAHQDNFFTSFTSDPLTTQTIAANTWTIAIAVSEANTNANSFLVLSLYVFRPSTGSVVGFIYDSDTALGVEWAAAEDGQVITFSGVSVVASAGDVLVLEVWRHGVQGMAVGYTQTIYYDGTTDVVDTTTADAASYLETPQILTFQAAGITLSPTAIASDEAFGSAKELLTLLGSGIISAEAFGSARQIFLLSPSGIASLEVFGTAKEILALILSGVASGEAIGSHSIQTAGNVIQPGGIVSAEAFGVTKQILVMFPIGISSAEALGLAKQIYLLTADGIQTSETFGQAVERLALLLTTIGSGEQIGTQRVQVSLIVSGIGSNEIFGNMGRQAEHIIGMEVEVTATDKTDIRDLIRDLIVEPQGGFTLKQALNVILSVLAGQTAAGGATFKTPDGAATRVVATLTSANERTNITVTPG